MQILSTLIKQGNKGLLASGQKSLGIAAFSIFGDFRHRASSGGALYCF
jgi:hypothetical protein